MDERRIAGSYVAAIIVPLCLGFWLNGVGHFVIGRYKRGIVFMLGTIALEAAIAGFLVAFPLVYGTWAPPWAEIHGDTIYAEDLLPGVLLTLLAGFLVWIWQILDLRRLNEALMKGKEKA
jgi:hypothetical protein